jgi:capsule polysaccharide export protein KpsE/RkpR
MARKKTILVSKQHPKVVTLLAEISSLTRQLHQLTKSATIADALDVSEQAIDYQVKKIEKPKKK